MTADSSLLAQGIAAAKAGDKSTARELLTRALRRDPGSETAWLWLGAVLDTPQGRAFCLRKVLALNPANQTAQRGLAALAALEKAAPGPVVVAQPQPVPSSRSWPKAWFIAAAGLSHRERFWQIAVTCLGIVALSLVGILAYATLRSSSAAEDEALAVVVPSPTPGPRGTLRPTFTTTPTDTPTATATATPTPTATATPTPTLTDTPTPTPTLRRAARPASAQTPTPTPRPRPTLPPCSFDPRLSELGVRIEPAAVAPGQPFWLLVEARWACEAEAAGKHSIFVEVLDANGNRAVGQPVVFRWADGAVVLPVEDRPLPDWGVNFPMYNTLGSYGVNVGGAPSDRIVGLGLGTAEAPHIKIHTSFYLVFRWVYR
jgi:Tetratricopeptide repeat